jgi:hypothetical protein
MNLSGKAYLSIYSISKGVYGGRVSVFFLSGVVDLLKKSSAL